MITETTPTTSTTTSAANAPATVQIAADIGNARAQIVAQVGDDSPVLYTMPATRSLDFVSSRDIFSRRGQPFDWRLLNSNDHVIEIEGVERYLGQLAIDYARANSGGRGSDRRYSDGTTRDFILAAIGATGVSSARVRLGTMLPISLWDAHHEGVRESLIGNFTYKYCGRPVNTKIESVEVFREGAAGYFGLPTPLPGRAIVIDAGGRTVNVALFREGEYIDGDTIDNMGLEIAFDAIDRQLAVDGLRQLRTDERHELQRRIVAGEAFSITHRGAKHRIDSKARMIIHASARTLVQELGRLFQIEHADSGAFIGGAGLPAFFGEIVAEAYPQIQLVEEPETRNVFGAFAQVAGQPAKRSRGRRRA